jgi:hypothetical protein
MHAGCLAFRNNQHINWCPEPESLLVPFAQAEISKQEIYLHSRLVKGKSANIKSHLGAERFSNDFQRFRAIPLLGAIELA